MSRTTPSDLLQDVDDSTSSRTWRPPLLWRFLLRLLRYLVPLFCRLRVTGNIPNQLRHSRLLVVANHIGIADPFVLIAACARQGLYPRFLATAGMFKTPIIGPIMRACGHIQVDRHSHTVTHALHHASQALDENACVVIYPEGRISLDPGLWPERAKTGAARLALRSHAPVMAVAQWGAHEITAWDRPGIILRTLITSLFRRPVAKVHFAGQVDVADLSVEDYHAARVASDRFTQASLDSLRTLRDTEPVMPHHIDPVRPLSTSRTFHSTHDTHHDRAAMPSPTTGNRYTHLNHGASYTQ